MTSDHDVPFFERAEPRPEFKDQLRRAFVDGQFDLKGEPFDALVVGDVVRRSVMGERTGEERLGGGDLGGAIVSDTNEARLSAALSPEPAPAEFVAELRARFVAAKMAGALEPAPIVPLRPVADRARQRRSFANAWRPVLALAAAALLAVTAVWWTGRAPAWTVFNQGVAVASVDGLPFSGSSLRPGAQPCEVCTPRSNLRLGFEDLFRLELAKDSAVRMASPVVGANGRVRAPIAIDSGEIVCVTLGNSRLESVVIETPTAFVRLNGASVSVLPHPNGSVCICVRSGSVTVESKLGERMEVVAGAGERAVVRPDGRVELASPDVGEGRLSNLAQACDDLAGKRFESADYSRAWNVLEAY